MFEVFRVAMRSLEYFCGTLLVDIFIAHQRNYLGFKIKRSYFDKKI